MRSRSPLRRSVCRLSNCPYSTTPLLNGKVNGMPPRVLIIPCRVLSESSGVECTRGKRLSRIVEKYGDSEIPRRIRRPSQIVRGSSSSLHPPKICCIIASAVLPSCSPCRHAGSGSVVALMIQDYLYTRTRPGGKRSLNFLCPPL
jgi:hypothetical protein